MNIFDMDAGVLELMIDKLNKSKLVYACRDCGEFASPVHLYICPNCKKGKGFRQIHLESKEKKRSK